MKASTINALSTVAISVGSFLLGGSLGLALNNCKGCYFVEHYIDGRFEDDEDSPTRDLIESMDNFGEEFSRGLENGEFEVDEETISQYKEHVSTYIDLTVTEDEDVEDGSYSTDVKEIEVNGDTVKLKGTEYGYEELVEPFIISRDSFENEYEDFSKNSLVYFEDDDVLTDDHDEVILDVDKTIGTEALNNFGEGSDDEDIVYVRNLSSSCDYEIVREHTSYQENVLGLSPVGDEKYKKALDYFNIKIKEHTGVDEE